MLTSLLILASIIAVAYLAICGFIYLRQDSLIFFPRGNDAELAAQWRSRRVEIASANGVIEGWWADNASASTQVTLLYFGGNAEDVLHTASVAERLNARRMLFTNYRGYGASPGHPSQSALYADGLAVYDYAVQQDNLAAKPIVVMGRSLGSGVATWIAAHRPVHRTVLVTPYDSLVAVAQRHYFFLPVRLLLKHRFASDALAGRITTPALIVAAGQDEIIPPVHAQRLADAWAGPKRIHVLSPAGHNDIEQHPSYYPLINEFLSGTGP